MRDMITPPGALEAILFASGGPVEKKRLVALLDIREKDLATTTSALQASLASHGIALVETETDLELRTAPEAAAVVKTLRESELSRDLGKGSLETLAVIAYHGGLSAGQTGATRSEIDWVRGVNSSASLRILLLRGLIEGREDVRDKRRQRYTLTTEALAHLGISSLDDLPRAEELSRATHAIVEASATETSA